MRSRNEENTNNTHPLELIKGVHYKDYIQSGENIDVTRLPGEDAFVFRIIDWAEYPVKIKEYHEAFVITPLTDLSAIDSDVLDELDTQMYYEGESDDEDRRFAKFSETRRHIQGR